MVNYLSWDANGEYLASVCQDCVKVWSLTSGQCIHEFSSNGNQFHSCVFHPSYSTVLVIGGNRVIPSPTRGVSKLFSKASRGVNGFTLAVTERT